MRSPTPSRRPLALLSAFFLLAPAGLGATSWPQFGGPGRDFDLGASEIEPWSEDGPRVLWWHGIGNGYSGIVGDESRVFTMAREGEDEVVVAFDADDGDRLWSVGIRVRTESLSGVDRSWGDGPRATPLVAEDLVVALGFAGSLRALRGDTGRILWTKDLASEHGVPVPFFGHAASPIRFGDAVLVPAGGVLAFDLRSGEPLWENRDFAASYSSPILVGGPAGERLILAAAGEIVALDPEDGRLLWRHEHANQYGTFLSTPVAGPDGSLFASAYFLGSVALRLDADGMPTVAWKNEDLQIAHTNALRLGGAIVASRDRSLVALDAASGRELWRDRGVGEANLLRVGAKVLLLTERGRLELASVGAQGREVEATAELLPGRSWTGPTLIGSRLFARNREWIVAVDLSRDAGSASESLASAFRRDPGPTTDRAPSERRAERDALERAALSEDLETLRAADATFGSWSEDPGLAPLGLYYRGLAAWHLSALDSARGLEWVDLAVEHLEAALRLDPDLAEAHALLSPLYSAYYRLSRGKAAVVGPLGDEHLSEALRLDPENPRVLLMHGLDLLQSPPRYGGDPEAGQRTVREAIRAFEAGKNRAAGTDPGPRWGAALARVTLAGILSRSGESAEAEALLREALALEPSYSAASDLLEQLAAGGGAAVTNREGG